MPPTNSGYTDFAEFYSVTLQPLRRYLKNIIGCYATAQDLAHDAYIRVFPVMQRKCLSHPQGYLYTTAYRLALNQCKRRRYAPVNGLNSSVIELVPSGSPGPVRIVMARQELAHLRKAMLGLPPGCRRVLELSRIEHLPNKDIAQRLDISCVTVEKQLARALRLLRQSLKHDPVRSPRRTFRNKRQSSPTYVCES